MGRLLYIILSYVWSCVLRFLSISLKPSTKENLSSLVKDWKQLGFVSTEINDSDFLNVGIDQSSLHCLQLVQNTAAFLLTGTNIYITPVLASFPWLPVHHRMGLRILFFGFEWSCPVLSAGSLTSSCFF